MGAAAVVAVGLGLIPSFAEIKKLIPAGNRFSPNPANKAVYDRNYEVFKKLHRSNRKYFALLNSP